MSLPYTPELRDEMIQEALKALLKENYCASYNVLNIGAYGLALWPRHSPLSFACSPTLPPSMPQAQQSTPSPPGDQRRQQRGGWERGRASWELLSVPAFTLYEGLCGSKSPVR